MSALTLGLKLPSGKVVSVSNEIGVGHAEAIAPAFLDLCDRAEIAPSTVGRIGVTVGPGSFMGQRVGIAFAKGLAMGLDAPTVPLTTLEALARTAKGALSVVIDARRGEVYTQRFGEDGVVLDDPQMLNHEDARTWLAQGPPRAVGSGLTALGMDVEPPVLLAPSADALLALTEERPEGALRTLYWRGPDAKPPRQKPL